MSAYSSRHDSPIVQAGDLVKLLSQPLIELLFAIHPNQLAVDVQSTSYEIPIDWTCWWDWATLQPNQWMKLVALNKFYQDVVTKQSFIAGIHQNDAPKVEFLDIPGGLTIETEDIPLKLRQMIWDCNRISFPRKTEPEAICKDCGKPYSHSAVSKKGMSPKKRHEVTHLLSCVANVVQALHSRMNINVRHFVDVGAGQGYLSRALRDLPLHTHNSYDEELQNNDMHVLALDSSVKQTVGAESRSNVSYKSKSEETSRHESDVSCERRSSSLTHRTLLVRRKKEGEVDDLESAIGEWLDNITILTRDDTKTPSVSDQEVRIDAKEVESTAQPIPVLFVALHACGSLTPTVLRSVMSYKSALKCDDSVASSRIARNRMWYAVGAVVVGCCYNLLESEDFPLSSHVSELCSVYSILLTPPHFQIAAQVPSQWFRSQETMLSASLAIRKVVYRALIEPCIRSSTMEPIADKSKIRKTKIGKLNDNSYESYGKFLEAAGNKLGYELSNGGYASFTKDLQNTTDERDKLILRLEVFHVLRCLLGPAIESLILLDRYVWLQDNLHIRNEPSNVAALGKPSQNEDIAQKQKDIDFDVELINIFDQGLDSGRNVGIMLLPESVLSYRRSSGTI